MLLCQKPFKTWLGLTKKFKIFCHTWKMRCFHQLKPYVIELNVPKTLFHQYQSNHIKMGWFLPTWQKSLKNFVNPSQILKVFVTEAICALNHFSFFSRIHYFRVRPIYEKLSDLFGCWINNVLLHHNFWYCKFC